MKISISKEAQRYIELQRTGFGNEPQKFVDQIKKEFEEIKPYLPKTCNSILDIGCGLSVIDVFFNSHYNGVNLFLADKDRIDEHLHFGYKANGSYYNSFSVTSEFLKANGVSNFKLISSEKSDDLKGIGKQDIIISLLSCGYHYPATLYLDKIKEILSPNGVFITDIREYTPQMTILERIFPNIEIIRNENKADRICCSRIVKKKKKLIGDKKMKRKIFHGPMRWDAILKRIPKNKKMIGAEIGILTGETASVILKERPLVTHIMIDPWKKQPRDSSYVKSMDETSKMPQERQFAAYEYTLKRIEFAGNRAVVKKMYSHEAEKTVAEKSLDYGFLDGDHSYEGCRQDIRLWFPKIKPGGWIGGHDYGNKRTPGVKKAVDEFFKGKKIELDYEETWFVRVEK